MRLPFTRRKKRRGPYRKLSAEQKANELLARAWLDDLRRHPEYAREIARQKFGITEPETGGEGGFNEPPPDLLEVLRQAREAKELIKDEISESKGEGTLQGLASILKEVPALLKVLPQLQPAGQAGHGEQRQITYEPSVKQIQEKEPELRRFTPEQTEILNFAEKITDMQPEQAAVELSEHKGDDDFRATIWRYLTQVTMEDLESLAPMIETAPEYEFLMPYVRKLQTKEGRKWLALLIDEVKKVSKEE